MSKKTDITTAGRHPEHHAGTVNTPIYQASTILFPTLKAYKEAEQGTPHYELAKNSSVKDYSYGSSGTPTHFALQEALAKLEGGDACLLVPSGLAAITLTLLATLKSGDHVLIPDSVYGPTRRFCNKELTRFGIETTYYDPLIGADIATLFQENTQLVFTESPGSLTFEVQDIPAIVKAAKEKNLLVAMDNSWATPLHFQPFEHGVDISIQAITKYIAGHSDLILGAVICKQEQLKSLYARFRNYGFATSPSDCALALRGLRTLDTRLPHHAASALKIAEWLEQRPEVARVLHPALPSDPGHALWKRDFTGANGLLTFILKEKHSFDAISTFVDHLELFGIGASWGGYESLIVHFDPTTIRTATKWKEQGSCIRLHIGLEDPADLLTDLEKAFDRLNKTG